MQHMQDHRHAIEPGVFGRRRCRERGVDASRIRPGRWSSGPASGHRARLRACDRAHPIKVRALPAVRAALIPSAVVVGWTMQQHRAMRGQRDSSATSSGVAGIGMDRRQCDARFAAVLVRVESERSPSRFSAGQPRHARRFGRAQALSAMRQLASCEQNDMCSISTSLSAHAGAWRRREVGNAARHADRCIARTTRTIATLRIGRGPRAKPSLHAALP